MRERGQQLGFCEDVCEIVFPTRGLVLASLFLSGLERRTLCLPGPWAAIAPPDHPAPALARRMVARKQEEVARRHLKCRGKSAAGVEGASYCQRGCSAD
jgi:hypothetical protein